MAMDTAQKRMSAISPGQPWRGPMVAAAEAGFTQGNRQAAAFMYSGIAAEAPAPPPAYTPQGRFVANVGQMMVR